MPLYYGLEELPCSTEWIDVHILQAYLWEVLNGIDSFIYEQYALMNPRKQLTQASNKARLIYYMVTKQSIEHKGIYL